MGGAAAQGERLLDSHIAPSAYRGRGTNWAALDHSRTKLEKLVLAEPPEHGQRARAWGGLHKHYQKAWLDQDGDRVPTVAALWFCAEVTRKKEHDERWVCVVAVALLAAAAEYEGVAAFETDHDLILFCALNEHRVDLVLGRAFASAALSYIDSFAFFGNQIEQAAVEEIVV